MSKSEAALKVEQMLKNSRNAKAREKEKRRVRVWNGGTNTCRKDSPSIRGKKNIRAAKCARVKAMKANQNV